MSLVGVVDSLAPGTAGFTDYKALGGETTPAPQYYSPSLNATVGSIVPAASSTAPGRLTVYVLAHLPAVTRAAYDYPPLTWQSLPESPALQYQWLAGYAYRKSSTPGPSCNSFVPIITRSSYHLNKVNQQLGSAKWQLLVAPKLTTGAFTVDATTPVVEAAPTGTAALPSISRTWNH
jgi:hypothetical protein